MCKNLLSANLARRLLGVVKLGPEYTLLLTDMSNIPLIMLCMFPHGLYSLLDYEINLSYLLSLIIMAQMLTHSGQITVFCSYKADKCIFVKCEWIS